MAERKKEDEESLFPGISVVENQLFDSEFIEKIQEAKPFSPTSSPVKSDLVSSQLSEHLNQS